MSTPKDMEGNRNPRLCPLFLTFLLFAPCQCVDLPERPNILLILADDLGYGDLQAGGHPTSETPNIDRLMQEAKVLTNFHVTSPVCSPSR